MCTILVASRCAPGCRLVLAANRDELVARASAPPGVLVEAPRVVGGRDFVAGGTWLALGADGRLAAVTNRRAERRDPTRRSRGELPLLALAAGGASEARRWVAALDPTAYNPCNLVVADESGVVVAALEDDGVRAVELPPGVHVVTTVDVDAAGDAKSARLLAAAQVALGAVRTPVEALAALEALLADHGSDGGAGIDAACIHGDVYGTVSSSSVLVDEGGSIVSYRHAQGRPCVSSREEMLGLLSVGAVG